MSDAPAGKRPSELATRTLTGLALIALALVALALGGFVFWLFCFGMSRYSIFMERRLAKGHKR